MKKWNELTKKQKNDCYAIVRGIIQLLYFLFLPGAFTAAFNGVKYLFTQIGAGEKLELTSFVTVLIVLCIFTILFGRFFCGFACAFGSLGDAVHFIYVKICRKCKKKPLRIPEKVRHYLFGFKYVVLAAIVLLCFAGVYGNARGTSPWDVFSMLHAGNFQLSGYAAGIVLLVLIVAGMAIEERFFCKFLCPMGAVFALLPVMPFFALCRDRDHCIPNCKACTMRCPSEIGLPATGTYEVKGDCFQCQKCIGTCPKGNIHCGISQLRGNEIWFTILRAGILLGLMIWMGI